MKIGIVTPYTRACLSMAAVQVAHHLLHDRGDSVSILTPTERPVRLSHYWDRHLVTTASLPAGRGFTTWFENYKPDVVIWTVAPRPEQVAYVNQKSVLSVLIASASESTKTIMETYPVFGSLIAPSQAVVDILALDSAFSDIPLNHMVLSPWSPFGACTKKDDVKQPPIMKFCFMVAQCPKVSDDLINYWSRLLTRLTNVAVTVIFRDKSHFSKKHRKRFKAFRSRFNAVELDEQTTTQVILSQHAYAVILGDTDPYGMSALCSLHAGTAPIVAGMPPYTEFVKDTVNGLHIGNDTFARLDQVIGELVAYPEFALEIQARVPTGLLERRAAWEAVWGRLLENVGR